MQNEISILTNGFAKSSKMLIAIGDETRLHLISEMLKIGDCNGVRVCKIAEKTNLSRPAVSHHLKILKETGLVKVRKEGTKNFYYFDPDMEIFENLISTLQAAAYIAKSLPDRSETHY